MVIGIFGESCVGKSTLAAALAERTGARVYTGKDYLRLAKSETVAKAQFAKLLRDATHGEHIIYVISERAHLSLLPEDAVRVLVTAGLDRIEARFAERMRGTLPEPVRKMLEHNHGCFDGEPHDFHLRSDEDDFNAVCDQIAGKVQSIS